MSRQARQFGLLLTLAIVSIGCALTTSYDPETYPNPVVTVSYFVTYPTTPNARLAVFGKGNLLFESLQGRRHLTSLSSDSLQMLSHLVDQPDLKNSLVALDAQRFDKILTDLTALEISAGSSRAVIPLDEITPEVRILLVELDALFQAELGRKYRHFLHEVGAIH